MTKEERKQRILATGEVSNHCHVVTGTISFNKRGHIIVEEDSNAVLKHLLQDEWMNGKEVWTGEHTDISLSPGIYEKVQQKVFDPMEKRIQAVKD